MAHPVLKLRHSLVGKSLIPIIGQVRAEDVVDFLARLKKEHPLENYSVNEMHSEFEKLTSVLFVVEGCHRQGKITEFDFFSRSGNCYENLMERLI